MEESQIMALRAALHRWIDQVSVEHLEQLDREVQLLLAGDLVAFPPEESQVEPTIAAPVEKKIPWYVAAQQRRQETDRMVHEARLKQMMAPKRKLPSLDEYVGDAQNTPQPSSPEHEDKTE